MGLHRTEKLWNDAPRKVRPTKCEESHLRDRSDNVKTPGEFPSRKVGAVVLVRKLARSGPQSAPWTQIMSTGTWILFNNIRNNVGYETFLRAKLVPKNSSEQATRTHYHSETKSADMKEHYRDKLRCDFLVVMWVVTWLGASSHNIFSKSHS